MLFIKGSLLQGHALGRCLFFLTYFFFSIWNYLFYCSFRCADFKTVFVFKIGPILVVRIIIEPPQIIKVPPYDEKNGKIVQTLIC